MSYRGPQKKKAVGAPSEGSKTQKLLSAQSSLFSVPWSPFHSLSGFVCVFVFGCFLFGEVVCAVAVFLFALFIYKTTP